MKNSTSLRIDQRTTQRPLSKAQATFNSLIGKIESARALLARWQAAMDACDETRAKDFAPLFEKFTTQQVAFVKSLDAVLSRTKLTKGERRAAEDYIYEIAGSLLESRDDDALEIIYKKHGGKDADVEEAEAVEEINARMKNMFGLDLGDDAAQISPEEMFRRFAEQIAKPETHGEQKKSPKQLARDAKLQQEADLANLSLREIYRKLVSALHPDREPDPVEQERKTALMQRVNQAYDKKNLLLLLELQLELEHIDASAIADMPDERVKRFNKVLKEQLGDLNAEIQHVEMGVCMQFNFSPFVALKPESLMPRLRQTIAEMKLGIARSTEESLIIKNPAAFKLWLKQLQREMKELRAMEELNAIGQSIFDDRDLPF